MKFKCFDLNNPTSFLFKVRAVLVTLEKKVEENKKKGGTIFHTARWWGGWGSGLFWSPVWALHNYKGFLESLQMQLRKNECRVCSNDKRNCNLMYTSQSCILILKNARMWYILSCTKGGIRHLGEPGQFFGDTRKNKEIQTYIWHIKFVESIGTN